MKYKIEIESESEDEREDLSIILNAQEIYSSVCRVRASIRSRIKHEEVSESERRYLEALYDELNDVFTK